MERIKTSLKRYVVSFRRSRGARTFGKAIEKMVKSTLRKILNLLFSSKKYRISELEDVHKVLIVRPNFRIGNTVISTSLIPASKKGFPQANIDYFGAENTLCLLRELGINRFFALSRHHGYRWISFLRLLRQLRKQRYDVVIDGSHGSSTSSLLCYCIGARYHVAVANEKRFPFANVILPIVRNSSVYESYASYAQEIQQEPSDVVPVYKVSDSEKQHAGERLQELLGCETSPRFVGVFVGGHLDKRFPDDFWKNLFASLEGFPLPVCVFTGPEEEDMLKQIWNPSWTGIHQLECMPLRETAAVSSLAEMIVSPDTGSMHLVAALHKPLVVLLQSEISKRYVPTGKEVYPLFKPKVKDVVDCLTGYFA